MCLMSNTSCYKPLKLTHKRHLQRTIFITEYKNGLVHKITLPTLAYYHYIIPQEEIAVRIHRVSDPTAKWL